MNDTPRTETAATPPPPRKSTGGKRGKGVLWGLLAVVVAFFAGFLWQFHEASTARGDLAAVEQELALERLRVHLGQAALAAQSDDYERARQQMSTFFDQLQEQGPDLNAETRAIADDFLSMRDNVITGLSRSNAEYAAVLYDMHQRLAAAIDRSLGRGAESDGGPASTPGPIE